MTELFQSASAAHIKEQREKARALRKTRWWKEKIREGICRHCGKKFPPDQLTMDHWVPLARGGKTGKNNVVVSCKTCNSKKSYQTLVEFKMKKI